MLEPAVDERVEVPVQDALRVADRSLRAVVSDLGIRVQHVGTNAATETCCNRVALELAALARFLL